MENPLLNPGPLPVFSTIDPATHIEPAIKDLIATNRAAIKTLLDQNTHYTWANFMAPIEEMNDKLNKTWSPIQHLHGVLETDALRKAYNDFLPLLTEYHTDIMQDARIFAAVNQIAEGPEFAKLNTAQQKVIKNELRDFKLSGVNLPEAQKSRLAALQQELSQLSTKFSENLLDATHSWSLPVSDPKDLKGLPESDLARCHKEGAYKLTLDYPCYIAAMKFLDNRDLRQKMYEAYVTRASDLDPMASKFDNSSIMADILKLRHEQAKLLGFKNYAEYSLATKMAGSPHLVMDFLNKLVATGKTAATKELAELQKFAHELDGNTQLEPWDIAYYSEKLRKKAYDISQEALKPYFPAPQVIKGLFAVVNKLYGLKIHEKVGVDTWHPDVQFFEIFDQNNQYIAGFYIDLYARPHKRDGAWMDDSRTRRRLADGSLQYPIAYLTCNFTPPFDNKPALLSQEEVETLFHEFGHCLHHMLTKVEYGPVSGINGVAWDAVEFPSQIMEHWCWDYETMRLISSHIDTGEVIPKSLFDKLYAAKNFHSALQMLRQLEFALFDFRIHLEYDPAKGDRIQAILNEVRELVSVVPLSAKNRFQHSFSHIFAGGYAAGYYSYKWAEVLSSDAFSLFEEHGIFDAETGKKYRQEILEVGGSREPMESFVAFRGREPDIGALLRHSGLG